MASLNKVLLIGNLTRDPELRYTPKGTAVADIGLAINRVYKTSEGEDREETCFVNIEVWGRQAETASQYLSKGSPVFIEGELKYESWTNKEGKKQSALRVRAERIQFLGRPKNAEVQEGGQRSSRPAKPSSPEDRNTPPADSGPGDAQEDDMPF